LIPNRALIDDEIVAKKIGTFRDSSLDTPSLGFDSMGNLLTSAGVIAMLATHEPYAAGLLGPALARISQSARCIEA
jgi:hypothetical protein